MWSTEHTKPLRILVGHASDVDCISWHPNGHYLVTGSSDCSVRMWDVSTGKCVRILTGGHNSKVSSVVISPNGIMAASGGLDGSIVVWDLESARSCATFNEHSSPIWSLSFDRYGLILAAGCNDASVSLYKVGLEEAAIVALKTYETKATTMYNVHFNGSNLLYALGQFYLNKK